MKLVLVQPKVGYSGLSYWEALGLGYLAAYAKSNLPDIDIEFYSGAFDSDEDIIRACTDADYVGFGCTSPQMKHALSLAAKIKLLNNGIRTIFGGYHPSALPFETAAQRDLVDKVICGEGEDALLQTLKGNTTRVQFSQQLDFESLPLPDRDVIKITRHVAVAKRETGENITSIQGSRGCLFQCVPCSNNVVHGTGPIRVRSPASIINEMLMLQKRYSIEFIKFCDATFNTSIERVKEFCEYAVDKDIPPWGCNIHASMTSKEMFEQMKQARCREAWIGVESGSPKVLKEIHKGTTVEQIKNAFKWSKEAGLMRRAYFMIGMPSETMEDVEMTAKLGEEIDADYYGFTIVCPFPGSQLYDPLKYGSVDWSTADEYGNTFYRTEHFTNEQLFEIQNRLREKFKDKLVWRLKK